MNRQRNDKRYVAHFDMLGFKSATCRNPDEAWGALSDFRRCMNEMLKKTIEIPSLGTHIRGRIKAHIFSDSVLIFSLGETPEDFIAILTLATDLFACSLQKCIPLRGGMSYGDFFFNDELQLFCGIPFVRAYELGETAQWSGIALDDIVYEKIAHDDSLGSFLRGDMKPPIIKWRVSVKSGHEKEYWVVNWPHICRKSFTKNPVTVGDYYMAFESLFGPYDVLAQDVKTKYENTVQFINASLS